MAINVYWYTFHFSPAAGAKLAHSMNFYSLDSAKALKELKDRFCIPPSLNPYRVEIRHLSCDGVHVSSRSEL